MALPAKKSSYTYADYLTWPEDLRCELLDGEIYDLAAPEIPHQEIQWGIFQCLREQLMDGDCRVFQAAVDVVLLDDEKVQGPEDARFVVQPDVFVVCNLEKIKKQHVLGAPDFVIEILSPSTAKKDQTYKVALYERFGVREYWTLQPEAQIVTRWRMLENGKFSPPEISAAEAPMTVAALGDLEIDWPAILPEIPEKKRPPEAE